MQLEGHYLKTVLHGNIDEEEVVKIAPLSTQFFGQLRQQSLMQAAMSRPGSIASRYMGQVLERTMGSQPTNTSNTKKSPVIASSPRAQQRQRPKSVASGRPRSPDAELLPPRPKSVLGHSKVSTTLIPDTGSQPMSASTASLDTMSYLFFGKIGKKSRVRTVRFQTFPIN